MMQTTLLQRFEDATSDARTQLRMRIAPRLPSGQVVLLAVDEDSLKVFGRWPWSRDTHGDLLILAGAMKPTDWVSKPSMKTHRKQRARISHW